MSCQSCRSLMKNSGGDGFSYTTAGPGIPEDGNQLLTPQTFDWLIWTCTDLEGHRHPGI